jgi:hypothetical protein
MAINTTNIPAESDCFKDIDVAKVSELHPNVSRIMLFVALEATASGEDPSYQQLIFTKDSDAVFNLGCPHVDCVNGGFDFLPLIRELIEHNETSGQGIVACQGWQDGDQATQPQCSLKAECRILVDYDSTAL